METSFVLVFFLCLAVLAVLRTSWVSARADEGLATLSGGSD